MLGDNVTTIVSTSPVRSNPSTEIIEATIASIRKRLPSSRIIITADGVRNEQASMRRAYNTFLTRVDALLNSEPSWDHIELHLFDEFSQQTFMTKRALPYVKTPIIFYVEHDMELISELPVQAMCDGILAGDVDVMRLTYNTDLEPYHEHMRLEEEAIDVHGVPAVRTWQWSQNPHFASTEYYRRIARDHFGDRRTYIEGVMLGVLSEGWVNRGMDSWNEHKVWIYKPWGNIQRCLHLDGRAGDAVYDEEGRDVR